MTSRQVTRSRVTVVGAGLAGLSAATALVEAGATVRLVEAAAQAGGRCRSYHDPQLGQTIDNGNHLVLSGNRAVARYRARIGADRPLAGPAHADYAFADLGTGERWTVRINDGRLPWWLLDRRRRVPGTHVADYLPLLKLARARRGRIDAVVPQDGAVWRRLLEPILLAALNTPPGSGAARLAAAVLGETVAHGGRAMRPLVAEPTLAAAFVAPALAWLADRGAAVVTGRRLRAIGYEGDRAVSLDWGDGAESLPSGEVLVLAVPPAVATALVPGLGAPDAFHAIVNGHFALSAPGGAPPVLGLFGGTAEWVFALPGRISVTVSAADRLVGEDREALARRFWDDVCTAYRIDAPMPRWQVVKEKRATFAATPDQDALRPASATRWRNLFLAGDWIDTGLPATIEGALRSGETAAGLAIRAALA